ncbi:MAG: DNA gyrase subunit A [Anaerolineaceae bacterium]|nr:DNA gyrase subunit A [Anaerolineaceae bacterium]MDD4042110.1 DNA gyrase subunit A [Anaerolineaceae bacterium]MDD4577804.1 DNA gyrase subunit A [Anaerolineaceae bacterium]
MISSNINKVNINAEMQQSYLDYAMSVIVSRALPDARDGLKPVQRRILYAMYDMGIRDNTPHKKSARIVGEVLGKYHPHGDTAVYDAMARMAQDFSERYLLVDGQGNFGSIDGDPPAAMRYTEARLSPISIELLRQLDLETVDFTDNFDGTLKEPSVLPSAIPNMLVNGASGIAVGMATNIPPHNLTEVVDALVLMLENWERIEDITVDDLMVHIKGPDFPTGGMILQDDSSEPLSQIYGSGHGTVKMRAQTRLEEMSRGRMRIIVTELPFMVNKSSLIEKIASIIREGGLEGITDLRDESDRQGMRIVFDLTKNADYETILTTLYKRTQMQSTFGINILALVGGSPHRLSLKQSLRVFVEHRIEVIRRRSEYLLRKNEERLHILKALRIAIQHIDEIIKLIKRSQSVDDARQGLMTKYGLDEIQANAILEMPLRRLASLERKKIEDEFTEVSKNIAELKALLKSPKRMRQVVIDELREVKEKYGDSRRTQIYMLREGEKASDFLTVTDVMPLEHYWVEISKDGLVSRTENDKCNRLGGENAPWNLIRTNSHQTIFLVTTEGNCAAIASLSIPVQRGENNAVPAHKLAPLHPNDILQSVFTVPIDTEGLPERYVITITRQGMIKRSAVKDLPGVSVSDFVLCKVNQDDELFQVLISDGNQDILIATASGMCIRFNENDARSMGLVAAGVNAIKLKEDDYIVGAALVSEKDEVALLTRLGLAKRTPASDFPVQGRYGQGVIGWKLGEKDQIAALLVGKLTDKGISHFSKTASKVFTITNAVSRKRAAGGQSMYSLKPGDEVIGFTTITDYSDYWGEEN